MRDLPSNPVPATAAAARAERPVVVVGSLNMDLVVRVERMPAAGETLTGSGFETAPGGKGANQAVAAARLGAPVAMVGCVGRDAHGSELLAGLAGDAIDRARVRALADVPTGVAVIVVEENGQNRIVLAPGANARVDEAAIDELAANVIAEASIIVMQLEIPLASVLHAARQARAAGATVLLNAAPAQALPEALWAAIDLLVVNESEAALLADTDVTDAASALEAAAALRARGPGTVIVTLGASGVAWIDGQGARTSPAHAVRAVDTTAAGDTFIGALAVALREGRPLAEAVALGQAASALCVTRRGAQPSIPSRHELVGEFAPRVPAPPAA
ncbi:MAG TPA: ribokinase [Burkholderiaceae bacterium]|nr:ribokinase [Burkholderiaceae bacterium]